MRWPDLRPGRRGALLLLALLSPVAARAADDHGAPVAAVAPSPAIPAPVAASAGLVVAPGIAVGAAGSAATGALRDRVRVQLGAESDSVSRARDAVEVKRVARVEQRARRARAAYKVLRTSAPMWAGAEVRMAAARGRAAARHLLARDRTEVDLLAEEAAQLAAAAARLAGQRALAEVVALPASGGLDWPAAGRIAARVGSYLHPASQATLSRRGLELRVAPGAAATAMADGVVRYAGPIRGLGAGVIVDHGAVFTVVARLASTEVATGAAVARGAVLGRADGRRLYLEVRVALGPAGVPVDPQTVLAPR